MAAGISIATTSRTISHFKHSSFLIPNPTSLVAPNLSISHSLRKFRAILRFTRNNKPNLTVCFALVDEKLNSETTQLQLGNRDLEEEIGVEESRNRVSEIAAAKRSKRFAYLVAAVVFGITSMAVYWQLEVVEVPYAEVFGTFAISVGAAVGMEFWSKWVHKALWHAPLWYMHKSHHKPREGTFELNDVFTIINSIPAIALLSYGFFHKGLIPRLCFGTGFGITVCGMAYMFVHDGLVHRRFPVGPIADIPYFRRVAAAHQIHHSDKFNGVPYGFFLGPKELEEVGGLEELDKEINRRIKLSKNL